MIESSHSAILMEFDVVVPVIHKERPLAYLLIGGLNKENRRVVDHLNNLSFIQTLTNIIVVAIENKRMARQSIIQERIKKELEVASVMQRLLFPSDLPSNRRMDISAKWRRFRKRDWCCDVDGKLSSNGAHGVQLSAL